MRNKYLEIKSYSLEELVNNENTIDKLKNIDNYLRALLYFCESNQININDYIDIKLYDTLAKNYKYMFVNFDEYDDNFYIDGIIEYEMFIELLKQMNYNAIKLNNNNFLLNIDNKILRKD